MFIVSLSYIKPIEEVELHLAEHIEYLKKQYEKKAFIASGRKVPRTGGVILSNVESKKELESILGEDPFHKNEIAKYEITEFIPTMTLPEFSSLIQN
ncbi:GTP cyclohydrolase [Geothermobacter hydrogeniphilus]|uniref:GTP cyclohydrolase n=1 Tax=Geothermobacter hydrogeniphilus TaxID=1969733 RepID=A0A2K2H953_9BACT|nr:YciI family protein [Geothermobacter hydrogeniphilus]PNU19807.1 GTP cyclohydrolase [Geothermobacter hydrogeniphilus]